MRTRIHIVVAALALAAAFGLSGFLAARPTRAQESMTHICDSTLITLLYIAEHDYGFHSMEMDLSTFEKGQYAPLFDAMMEMMEGDAGMEDMEETMTDMSEMPMSDDMVMLTPGHIEGEDEACTALRTELDTFLYQVLSAEMMAMESGS
jgi:hypothetical protein